MHISEKAQRCGLSPMRKFHPMAVEAARRGTKIYHLNIGQPDIPTPPAFFDAVRDFASPVLAYAESPGIPPLIDAVRGYYRRLDVSLEADDVLITTGGIIIRMPVDGISMLDRITSGVKLIDIDVEKDIKVASIAKVRRDVEKNTEDEATEGSGGSTEGSVEEPAEAPVEDNSEE